MRRAAWVLLAMSLAAPAACTSKPEVDPAEAAAKRQRSIEEAKTRLRNHKLADAEKIFKRVLAEAPEEPEALAGLAQLRYQQNRYEEAEQLVKKSIQLKGDVSRQHALLGKLYAQAENHAEAASSYGKAFELDPEKSEFGLPYGVELKLSKNYASAEKILRQVQDLDPKAITPDQVGVNTHLGDAIREQGRIDEALKIYMRALKEYPGDEMAHAGAAQVYEAKDDVKHAKDHWSEYIRMDCCSDFSRTVAQKKVMELKLPPPEDTAGEAAEGEQAANDGDEPPAKKKKG